MIKITNNYFQKQHRLIILYYEQILSKRFDSQCNVEVGIKLGIISKNCLIQTINWLNINT